MLGEILLLKKYIIKIADWSLPFTYGPLNITAEDARKIIKRLRWRKNMQKQGTIVGMPNWYNLDPPPIKPHELMDFRRLKWTV